MSRIIIVSSGIAGMRALNLSEAAPGGAALSVCERVSASGDAAPDLADLPSSAVLPSPRTVEDFADRIDQAVSRAHDQRLRGVAQEIEAALGDFEECELAYLAMRLTQGFYPRSLRRTLLMISDMRWSVLSELMPGFIPLPRTVGQMQRAMRGAAIAGLELLVSHLDRVTTVAIASAVLTFFPHDEVIDALARVTRHLDGEELYALARQVARRLPDTYGYRRLPRRDAYYESCVRYLIDALPRLALLQRARVAYPLMRCAYLSDEGEERLRPLLPFPTKRALLLHFFSREEIFELHRLGMRDAVAAELAGLADADDATLPLDPAFPRR